MPENKEKITQNVLADYLKVWYASTPVICIPDHMREKENQAYNQFLELVKESENWFDEDGEFLHLPDILDAHKKFALQQFNNWTPTAENFNALPAPIRNYIADLETNADPPSMIRENVLLRDTIKALELRATVTRTEIENAVGDTSDEYLEGVIELFEEKGFTVEMGK